jgi:hypothetical protein
MAASFARGEWPFWTPNVFAGHPQIADPQSMLFSAPFVILALLDPAPGAWIIDSVVFVMLLVAGLAAGFLARDLGWRPAAALVTAIVFAFGAAMAWRLQHFGQVLSLAYLPPTLLFLRRALTADHLHSRIGYGALAGLMAAFIVLGRDQVGLLCLYLLAAYAAAFVFAPREPALAARLARALPPLAAGGIVGLALITVPILLTLALADQSNRPEISFEGAGAGSLHPALLLTALVPHLYGAAGEMAQYWGPPSFTWRGTGLYLAQNMGLVYIGALPLLLILFSAVRGDLLAREIRFFTIAWLLAVLYALGWYTPAFRWAYEFLPGVSFYRRPADATFLIGGLAAFLAGFAADRLLAAPPARRPAPLPRATLLAATFVCVGFFTALAVANHFDHLDRALTPIAQALAWFALAAAALVAAWRLAPRWPLVAGLCLVLPTALDVVWNNGPNGATALPRAALDMLEPDGHQPTIARLEALTAATRSATRHDRIEMVGLGYHWPNTPLTHGFHSTLGANPVRLALYVRATGAGDTVAVGDQRAFTPLFPSYRSPLADLLGLRYIAAGQPIETIDRSLASNPLPLVARTPDAFLYENPGALPRVLFPTRAAAADFDAILASGRWPHTDFADTVLLEARAALENVATPAAGRRPGKITIADYRNTCVRLAVDSPDGGWAVLNDVWHPWWRAEVDGHPAPLLRANVLFRAVAVPPGRHTVTLRFAPLESLLEPHVERRPVAAPGSSQ